MNKVKSQYKIVMLFGRIKRVGQKMLCKVLIASTHNYLGMRA